MNDAALPLLARLADALERLARAAPAAPDFAAGRLFRHEPQSSHRSGGGGFVPAHMGGPPSRRKLCVHLPFCNEGWVGLGGNT